MYTMTFEWNVVMLAFTPTHFSLPSFFLSTIQSPSAPFEDALYAMKTENLDLLHNYLSCDHVSVNEADVSGNTLLHYAVAMGKIDIVRIVCNRLAVCACVCVEGRV